METVIWWQSGKLNEKYPREKQQWETFLMKQIHCDKKSFIVKEKPFPTLYWLIDNLQRKLFIAPKAFELFNYMSCFYGWRICDHDWNLWLTLISFWRFTSQQVCSRCYDFNFFTNQSSDFIKYLRYGEIEKNLVT